MTGVKQQQLQYRLHHGPSLDEWVGGSNKTLHMWDLHEATL